MALSFYIEKLNNLSIDSKPVWGIMSSQHMVEHLIQSVQLSNGKIEITECMTPAEKLTIMKRFLLSNRPMPKNFVNTVVGAELKPLVYPSLINAVGELKIELENMVKFFSENPDAKPMNPTFGPLNGDEWIHFHIKHFNHHLRQFGLLEEEE